MCVKEKEATSAVLALNLLFHLTGLIPLLFAFTYLLFALAAAVQVGHWPSYGQPIPPLIL
ncbi:MAG: hypothetical protein R3300_13975 [Candidatus Promineifilaceae bacterium]|nr:hypothetical protein [Candidatus Promineifilaceae bacterium]